VETRNHLFHTFGGSIVKNLLKITLILAISLSASAVLAFHDGGVARCAGCHTMHNSQDGALVDPSAPLGHAYLLKAGSATDQCLTCHASYGQFAGGTGYGAGGDFYWVTRTFSWDAHGRTTTSEGDSHGHNVISATAGIAEDATLSQAPGGDFLSQYLGCTSCHDPHGNQSFRLLYGSDMGPKYNGGRYNFAADAPEALGNSRRTVSGGGIESDEAHTVYKNGVSDWCANCHEAFHSANTGAFVHPIQAMGSTVAGTYNAYINSDVQVGGDPATSYSGLVPFEAVNVDLTVVDSSNYTQGPTSQDQVMCLTCHRAHASAFGDAARWDMGETFLVDSHPNVDDNDFVQEDVDNKYYNYTFVTNQRSLCNKCHNKDFGDAAY
jgi:hypothetical protein